MICWAICFKVVSLASVSTSTFVVPRQWQHAEFHHMEEQVPYHLKLTPDSPKAGDRRHHHHHLVWQLLCLKALPQLLDLCQKGSAYSSEGLLWPLCTSLSALSDAHLVKSSVTSCICGFYFKAVLQLLLTPLVYGEIQACLCGGVL